VLSEILGEMGKTKENDEERNSEMLENICEIISEKLKFTIFCNKFSVFNKHFFA